MAGKILMVKNRRSLLQLSREARATHVAIEMHGGICMDRVEEMHPGVLGVVLFQLHGKGTYAT